MRKRSQIVRLDADTLDRLDRLAADMGPLGVSRAGVIRALVEGARDGGDVIRRLVDARADPAGVGGES